MPIALSLLDLAPIAPGQTARDALEACVALARAAERSAYRRVWYAEHHNMPTIASGQWRPPVRFTVASTGEGLGELVDDFDGAQSLHTNGLDEAYTIPSELAMKVALRTQQIIADETNIPNVVDPLGGSYYVEALTDEIERGIHAYFERIDELGGTIAAIEQGFFQREIADSAYDFAQRKSSGQRPVIGVNKHVDGDDDQTVEVHRLDPDSERRQIQHLAHVKRTRDQARAADALARLRGTDGGRGSRGDGLQGAVAGLGLLIGDDLPHAGPKRPAPDAGNRLPAITGDRVIRSARASTSAQP
jgi:hypothetical protein